MQHNYLMDNLNALFCISLQQTTFVYVLKRRSNTQCKTEKSHTAVSHRTNRSHTGHNARKHIIRTYIHLDDLSPFIEHLISMPEIFSFSH